MEIRRINGGEIFYYHPNHLASTMYVTDVQQSVVQSFLYAPYGEITTEYNVNFGNNVIPKYSFNAKELDEETGMYYYEARYYAPPTFTSRDPLFEKYFWISPYAYCANNPVKYVDPSGDSVVADNKAQENIKLSLTKREARFVSFDRNGILNSRKLNKSKSTSAIMTALKALAKSNTNYIFSVADKDLEGKPFYNDGEKDFYFGVSHIPNNVVEPSPDNNVYIITWKGLDTEKQVKNTAHEAFGHAYFYELKLQGQEVEYNHTYSLQLKEDGTSFLVVPTNNKLENQISIVERQAVKNYKSRKK